MEGEREEEFMIFLKLRDFQGLILNVKKSNNFKNIEKYEIRSKKSVLQALSAVFWRPFRGFWAL